MEQIRVDEDEDVIDSTVKAAIKRECLQEGLLLSLSQTIIDPSMQLTNSVQATLCMLI